MTALAEGMYCFRERPDCSFCPAVVPSSAPLLDTCLALAALVPSVAHLSSSIGCRLPKSVSCGARTEWRYGTKKAPGHRKSLPPSHASPPLPPCPPCRDLICRDLPRSSGASPLEARVDFAGRKREHGIEWSCPNDPFVPDYRLTFARTPVPHSGSLCVGKTYSWRITVPYAILYLT